MKRLAILSGLTLVLVAGLAATGYVSANPSADFYETEGEVFDDWGICRTRSSGEDGFYQRTETGFRPVIAFESLGESTDLAYSLGERIAHRYPDPGQRAEQIFFFVRDRVQYTPDSDQFRLDEFAQNADELATTIDQNWVAYGDCEDSTVLLAVMYKAAGLRSAIVVGSGHTAVLVHLPDHKKTATVFELEGEPGWVWAEATGKKNPLGWAPKEFLNVNLAAYEISDEAISPSKPSTAPSIAITKTGKGAFSQPFPFIGVIGLLWFISLFRRRR